MKWNIYEMRNEIYKHPSNSYHHPLEFFLKMLGIAWNVNTKFNIF